MNLGAETACALGPPRPLRLRLDPPRSDATPVAPSPCAQCVRVCACVCACACAGACACVRVLGGGGFALGFGAIWWVWET